jgi:glycosyltransferase involved in cell wall biosynthesis
VRVLHLVHQYLPEHVGGTELYTQSVARALVGLGHQTGIFYRHHAAGQGLKHHRDGDVALWAAWSGLENPTRRFMATFGDVAIERLFVCALDDFRPDLVHVQHLMGFPVQLLRLLCQRRIPYVVTLHDYWWICANAQLLTNYGLQICDGPRLWLNCGRCALARAGMDALWPAAPALVPVLAARARLQHQALDQADQLIAPTRFVKDWHVGHGLSAAQIEVLPHGIERPLEPAPRVISTGSLRFAYIGGLAWQKGIHVLIEAFKRVKGEAELWVAGSEASDPAYAHLLRSMAGPRVRFMGELSREQVWGCLAEVDVLAVPSLWYEAFSLIAHEAFLAGTPVIASRLGALAEVVQDGVDGLLVPPNDVSAWTAALQRLVDEPALFENLRTGVQAPMGLTQHVQFLCDAYERLPSLGGRRFGARS